MTSTKTYSIEIVYWDEAKNRHVWTRGGYAHFGSANRAVDRFLKKYDLMNLSAMGKVIDK